MHNAEQLKDEKSNRIIELKSARPTAGRKIQSVERALRLLELLAEGELRLSAISKALNLNISTCHHLLSTLVEHGYVAQSGHDRSYFLGNRINELSRSQMRRFNIVELAMKELRTLNERIGETVHLAVLQGGELVTLAVLDSHHAVRVGSTLGGKSDAVHATATGKAILAWLPEQEIERIIERRGVKRFTDNTIVDRLELLENLRLVRRNGYAMDNEEYQPGVVCIGAAIRDHSGAVIGSFSCSMPSMRADSKLLSAVKHDVKATARSLSDAVGGAIE